MKAKELVPFIIVLGLIIMLILGAGYIGEKSSINIQHKEMCNIQGLVYDIELDRCLEINTNCFEKPWQEVCE